MHRAEEVDSGGGPLFPADCYSVVGLLELDIELGIRPEPDRRHVGAVANHDIDGVLVPRGDGGVAVAVVEAEDHSLTDIEGLVEVLVYLARERG